MSPLWRERVIIGLAPDRLSALHLGGGWRKRLVDHHDQALPTEHVSSWEAAVQAMQTLLATPAWSKGTIDVILTNHWVHYAIVPGQRGLGAIAQKTLAGIVFEKTYGDLCQHWEIRVSPAADGEPVIASGVPRRLLDALRSSAGNRLRAIRPALMPVFNRARRSAIGKSSGHIALLEHGRTTVASLKDGHWQSIISRAVAANDPDALFTVLHHENALQGQPQEGPLWLCDLGGGLRIPSNGARPIHTLEPPPLPKGVGDAARACLAQWGVQ